MLTIHGPKQLCDYCNEDAIGEFPPALGSDYTLVCATHRMLHEGLKGSHLATSLMIDTRQEEHEWRMTRIRMRDAMREVENGLYDFTAVSPF